MLLDRGSAAVAVEGAAAGLQEDRSGVQGRAGSEAGAAVEEGEDEDECCTNREAGHDFNCDANMRRYRKYLRKVRDFTRRAVAAVGGGEQDAEGGEEGGL